jgi:hypothetical protein
MNKWYYYLHFFIHYEKNIFKRFKGSFVGGPPQTACVLSGESGLRTIDTDEEWYLLLRGKILSRQQLHWRISLN